MLKKNYFSYASKTPAQIASGSSIIFPLGQFVSVSLLFLLLISGAFVFHEFNVDIGNCLNPSSRLSSTSLGENSASFFGEQKANGNDSSANLSFPFAQKYFDMDGGVESSVTCGTWQSEYKKLHEDIVAENKRTGKGRLLIFTGCKSGFACGGIGDHLVGFSSTLLLGIVFRRAVFVEWPGLEASEAFVPATFDWRIKSIKPNNENIIVTDSSCNVSPEASDSFELNFINYGPGTGEDLLVACLTKLDKASTIRIHSNRGLSHWAVLQPPSSVVGQAMTKYGMKPSSVGGCLLRNLVKPNKRVLAPVESTLKEMRTTKKLKICIHSRYRASEDADLKGNGLDIDLYMRDTNDLLQCAESLYSYWGQESVGTLWFFMSGSAEVKRRVKNLFPDRILESGISPMHTNLYQNRSLSMETTVAEWFLFSQCHFFLFHSSGMSKTAAAYALRPFSMYTFPNYPGFQRKPCNPAVPNTAKEVGDDWSGL